MQTVTEYGGSYQVQDGWTMPALTQLVPEHGSFETETEELTTSYYDTAEGTLAALGITLRRREGGADAGWHLKLPAPVAELAGPDGLELPSTSVHEAVPPGLLRPLEGLLHGLDVSEVATITTSRRTHVVRDADGSVVVAIADDNVRGTALGEAAGADSWREVEVGAGPSGTEKALTRAGKILTKAGAEVARNQVKLVRLLDGVGPSGHHDEIESTPKPDPLTSYVQQQCIALLLGEVALRQAPAAAAVHATRTAGYRLRSTLRMFTALIATDRLDPDDTLDDDLGWFTDALGAVGDLDSLETYFAAELAALPAELVLGPVGQHLQEEIGSQRQAALRRWQDAWADPRYTRVITVAESLCAELPLVDPKSVRRKNWPREAEAVLARADRVARQRLAEVNSDPRTLHRAWRATQRLRYTADLVEPDVPRAEKQSRRAKSVQKLLDGHQDRVLAAVFLREQGARAGSQDGHNGFTYGVLAERADRQAREIRRSL